MRRRMDGQSKAMTARMVGAGDDDEANGWTGQGNDDKEDQRTGQGDASEDGQGG